MLNRGFSLLEMLFALMLISFVMITITVFYPQFQITMIKRLQQYRLEQLADQVLSGLFKDIRRAGFIAHSSTKMTDNPAIAINSAGDCIIIRYDASSNGIWHDVTNNHQQPNLFAYRYYKGNIESQIGASHCEKAVTRWDKLFDPHKIEVVAFDIKQYSAYVRLNITVKLIRFPSIYHRATYHVKHYNI